MSPEALMFKKTYKAVNARKFKRIHTDYLLKFQLLNSKEPPIISNIKDLSAGGLRFWTDRMVPQDALVRVSVFVPPLDRTIEALGSVQRVRRAIKAPVYYVSVGFVELNQEDQEAINQFVEGVALQPGANQSVHHPEIVNRSTIS